MLLLFETMSNSMHATFDLFVKMNINISLCYSLWDAQLHCQVNHVTRSSGVFNLPLATLGVLLVHYSHTCSQNLQMLLMFKMMLSYAYISLQDDIHAIVVGMWSNVGVFVSYMDVAMSRGQRWMYIISNSYPYFPSSL